MRAIRSNRSTRWHHTQQRATFKVLRRLLRRTRFWRGQNFLQPASEKQPRLTTHCPRNAHKHLEVPRPFLPGLAKPILDLKLTGRARALDVVLGQPSGVALPNALGVLRLAIQFGVLIRRPSRADISVRYLSKTEAA